LRDETDLLNAVSVEAQKAIIAIQITNAENPFEYVDRERS